VVKVSCFSAGLEGKFRSRNWHCTKEVPSTFIPIYYSLNIQALWDVTLSLWIFADVSKGCNSFTFMVIAIL
jgi:hypothetical protein